MADKDTYENAATSNEAESGVDGGVSSSSEIHTSSSEQISAKAASSTSSRSYESPKLRGKTPIHQEDNGIELKEIRLHDVPQNEKSRMTYEQNNFHLHVEDGGIPESSDSDQKPNDNRKKYSFFQMFRYADALDIFLMITGVLLALAQGAGLPAGLLIYAKILNAMITHGDCWKSLKQQYANATSGNLTNVTVATPKVPTFIQSGESLFDLAGPQCGYYALIGLGVFVAGILHATAWTIAGERQTYRIRTKLFRAMLNKDVAWFDEHRTGALNHVLFEMVRKMEEGMTAKVSITISWLGTAIIGFIVAFVTSWLVSIVICSLVPLLFAISFIMIRLIRAYTLKQSEAYGEAGSIASEVISNWRTVLAFNRQESEVTRYGEHLRQSQRMGTIKTVASGASQGLMLLIIYCIAGLAFWWGNSAQVSLEGGTIMQIFTCILLATMSLGNASPNFENFGAALAAAEEVFSIIDEKSRIDNFDDSGTWLESLRGDIRLENVGFAYPARPDRPVLRSISLSIPRGKTIALVGPSGCGKSTVVQLLLRFYDTTSGKITVDNVDIRDLNVRWFRQQIGLVNQEPILFNTTIRDNIRMGAVDQAYVSDDDIVKACRLSNAHDFITKLPMGYDTMVGERGAQLSGGQKQRIAIARALVSNPRILVLDEATSALDTSSEAVVQEALDKARVGRTTLVIAHRLSTIRHADQIAVVDDGHIAELGTHDQLMERDGLYCNLVKNQQRANEVGGETLNGSELDLTSDVNFLNEEDNHTLPNVTKNESLLAVSFTGGTRPTLERLHSTNSISSRGRTSKQIEANRRPSLGIGALERGDVIDKGSKEKPLNRFQLMATVLRWNRPELGLTIVCAIISILAGGVQPAYAIILSEFMGSFCPSGTDDKFKILVGLVVMLGVVQAILLTAQHYLFAVIGERLTGRMRCKLLGKVLCMDAAWLDREENQSSILTTILATDCIDIQGICGIRIGLLLSAIVILGVAIVYSLILDYRIALALLGLVPLIVAAGITYSRVTVGNAPSDDVAVKEGAMIAMDATSNMRTVIALAAEPYFLEQFANRFVDVRYSAIKTGIAASPLFSFTMAAIIWAGAITFSLGTWLMERNETDFLNVIRIYVLITFSGFAIGRQSTAVPEEDKARKATLKIIRVLNEVSTIDVEDPDTGDSLAAKQLVAAKLYENKCAGRIEFKNVAFSYPTRPGVQVLSDVSFSVNPGQCVALCGPSGGGKSTIVQLVQRLYDPKSGHVLIDGADIRSSNVRWVRGNIGLVAQEPVLFGVSIGENIAYGSNVGDKPELKQIESVCKQANAADFIEHFPDRYDTQVGERGAQLSGGQKQRVAIARALVRNPSILLLDEATSALDSESERVVQQALEAAEEGRTCIVIAHRLSTIQNADKIVVIERGRVVEEGTHLELMRLRGTYYTLQQMQSKQQSSDDRDSAF